MVYQKTKCTFLVQIIKLLFLMVCIFEHCLAGLKSCTDEKKQSRICLTDKNGYVNPFPVVLSTLMYLREITEVNEDKNSITIHAELISIWKDPRLAASNSTK